MIAPALIDDLETRLDSLMAEARLRERRQSNTPRVGASEVAGAMAEIRRTVRCWGARAAVDTPRDAVMEHWTW